MLSAFSWWEEAARCLWISKVVKNSFPAGLVTFWQQERIYRQKMEMGFKISSSGELCLLEVEQEN